MKKILSTILAVITLLMPASILTFAEAPSSQSVTVNFENLPDSIKEYLLNTTNLEQIKVTPTSSRSYILGDLFKSSSSPSLSQLGALINSCDFSGNNIIEKTKFLLSKSIILSTLSTGFILLNSFSSHSKNLMYTLYTFDFFKRKVFDAYNLVKSFIPKKEYSVNESIERLNKELETIKGQTLAKEKIRKIICGITHEKNLAKSSKENYSHGDILYFSGASGVGKSLAAKRIANALSDSKPFVISASEIDKESSYSSVVEQLFNLRRFKGDRDDMYVNESSSLVKYLERNPNGIVIINEYDKMWSKSLDEILRTIADDGVISIRGQTIDCSGIIFIITSNESSGSVNGGNQDKDEEIDDGTGSRTAVRHDKSFLNRINIVEFENLSQADYEEIAVAEYNDKLINYWKNYAGVDLCFGDTFKHVAMKTVSENKGARTIKKVMDGLTLELGKLLNSPEFKTKDTNLKILVSYDENTDTFSLSPEKEEASAKEDTSSKEDASAKEAPSENETSLVETEEEAILAKESVSDKKDVSIERNISVNQVAVATA